MLKLLERLFWPKEAKETREKDNLVSDYVDTLNKYGVGSVEERAHYAGIVEQHSSLSEILDTSKELTKFRKSDFVRELEAMVVSKYIDTLNKYGVGSVEEKIYHTMVVEKCHPSLRKLLDATKDVKVMFKDRDLH